LCCVAEDGDAALARKNAQKTWDAESTTPAARAGVSGTN